MKLLLLSMPDSFEHTPTLDDAHAERCARVDRGQHRSVTTTSPSPTSSWPSTPFPTPYADWCAITSRTSSACRS